MRPVKEESIAKIAQAQEKKLPQALVDPLLTKPDELVKRMAEVNPVHQTQLNPLEEGSFSRTGKAALPS